MQSLRATQLTAFVGPSDAIPNDFRESARDDRPLLAQSGRLSPGSAGPLWVDSGPRPFDLGTGEMGGKQASTGMYFDQPLIHSIPMQHPAQRVVR